MRKDERGRNMKLPSNWLKCQVELLELMLLNLDKLLINSSVLECHLNNLASTILIFFVFMTKIPNLS